MATPPETDNSLDSKSEDEIAYNQTANNRQPTLEEKQLVCEKRLVLLFVASVKHAFLCSSGGIASVLWLVFP
jgi:hypothetical protein